MPVIFAPELVEGRRVYRGKRRNEEDDERQALSELQTILNAKNRRSCDCEAQLHDLLENCLNCGRLTCVAEGPGKCFACDSVILNQDQRERLGKHIDIHLQPPEVSGNNNRSNGGQQTVATQSTGPTIRIIDSQFDLSAIDNKRHLREDEKRKLRESLEELQAKRYQRKLMLNVDIDNLEAGASSVPLVEDYAGEMQKLQISQPEDKAGQTLAQKLLREEEQQATKSTTDGNRNKQQRQPRTSNKSKQQQQQQPRMTNSSDHPGSVGPANERKGQSQGQGRRRGGNNARPRPRPNGDRGAPTSNDKGKADV